MKTPGLNTVHIVGIIMLVYFPTIVTAQTALIPHHTQPLLMHSGTHEGRAGVQPLRAFRQVVRVPNAPWLRLHFSNQNLGRQSFITITSPQDGAQQRLDATSMKQWQQKSAFFNGEAVEVE